MQKIMFNDKYGLQRAAIDGTKPMTRRAVKENTIKDAEAYVQKIHGTGHDFFDYLLEKCNIICTPGSGFGENGEGFIRLSSFGSYENTLRAVERLKNTKF